MPRHDRSNIRVNCPQCLATLDVDSSQAGQRVICPKCTLSLQVPSAGVAGANLFQDLFDDEPGSPAAPPAATSPSPSPAPPPASTGKPLPSPGPRSPSPSAASSGSVADPLDANFDFDPASLKPGQTPAAKQEKPPTAPPPKPPSAPTAKPDRTAAAASPPPRAPTPTERKPAQTVPAPAKPLQPAARKPNPLADEDIFGLPTGGSSDDDDPIDLTLKPLDEKSLPQPVDLDPLAVDPDAPIVIEGIESGRAGTAGTITVRCRVCDSSLQAPEAMLDKRVVCPDCGSEVLVILPAKPKDQLPAWARPNDDWREHVRLEDEKRYPLGVKMNLVEPVEEVPSGWGLPDATDEVLRQVPKLEPELDEYGDRILGGASPNRIVDGNAVQNAPFLGGVLAAQEQTRKRTEKKDPPGAKKDSGKKPADDGEYSLAYVEDEPAEKSSGGRSRLFADRDRSAAAPDPKEPDNGDESPGPRGEHWTAGGRYIIKLENLGAFDGSLRRWLRELVLDRELWIRCAAAVGLIGLSYWMLSIMTNALADEGMSSGEKSMKVIFPIIFGGICIIAGWLIALMTGGLVFQQSGDRRPRFEDWPGFGVGEWGEALLFFCVSLWLGSLPGLLLGLPLMFSNMAGLAMVVATLSAVVFSPPLLLAAWYNGSAFQVYSKDVFSHFRGKNVDWLRYLPGSLAAWLLFGIGYGVTWIPAPFMSFVGAAMHVAGTILFATTCGLYCGLMARRIEKGL